MNNNQSNTPLNFWFPQNEIVFTQGPHQPFSDVAEFQQSSETSVGPERSRKVSRDARHEKKIGAEQARRDAMRVNTNILRNKLPRSYERDATSDPKVLEKVILYIDYLETELGLAKEKKDELPPPTKSQQSFNSGSIGTSGNRGVPQSHHSHA